MNKTTCANSTQITLAYSSAKESTQFKTECLIHGWRTGLTASLTSSEVSPFRARKFQTARIAPRLATETANRFFLLAASLSIRQGCSGRRVRAAQLCFCRGYAATQAGGGRNDFSPSGRQEVHVPSGKGRLVVSQSASSHR